MNRLYLGRITAAALILIGAAGVVHAAPKPPKSTPETYAASADVSLKASELCLTTAIDQVDSALAAAGATKAPNPYSTYTVPQYPEEAWVWPQAPRVYVFVAQNRCLVGTLDGDVKALKGQYETLMRAKVPAYTERKPPKLIIEGAPPSTNESIIFFREQDGFRHIVVISYDPKTKLGNEALFSTVLQPLPKP